MLNLARWRGFLYTLNCVDGGFEVRRIIKHEVKTAYDPFTLG
jgi:hypothetical protein